MAAADRNLLFGILAVQTGFIDRDVLHRAFNAWASNQSRALGDVLVDQQALTPSERQYLDELADRAIANHNGDASRTLAGLDAAGMARALMTAGEGHPPAGSYAREVTARDGAMPPTEGPRFSVLRPHAKGGLGQVHVAYDRELNREVALKKLLSHVADSNEVRSRFLQEARITSLLEHPGIVPMYGLGVDAEGRPYYVMRLIRGNTMQRAIDHLHGPNEQRSSQTEQFDGDRRGDLLHLLRQFIVVCQTVAYTHTRCVIHRDLKPANIVLGDYGETFVIDWGLAKVLGQSSDSPSPVVGDQEKLGGAELPPSPSAGATPMATETGRLLGTPAYMSPEQAAGRWDQLAPASDIFSLGSILYAILTGRPPCIGDSQSVVADVRAGKWAPALQINAAVPAALDAVCRKAMAFNPSDRYVTASDLAADIERWLADDPVTAWIEPFSVRLGRWVRRHRSWVAAATALMLTTAIGLAIGLVVVDQERRKTDQQRVKTQAALDETAAQRQRTRDALEEMTSGVTSDWLATQKELLPQQKQFLERSLAYYQDFAKEHANDESSRVLLAKAQLRVASMLQRLARNAEAEPSYRSAIDNWNRLAWDFPANVEYRGFLGQSQNNLATLLSSQGNKTDAETAFREAIATYEAAKRDAPTAPEYRRRLAEAHRNYGVLLKLVGRIPEAETEHRQAVDLQRVLVAESPAELEYQSELAQSYNVLGNVLAIANKKSEAEELYHQALELQSKVCEAMPSVAIHQRSLAKTFNNLAILLNNLGKKDDAEAAYRRMVTINEKVVISFPGVPDHLSDLAAGLYNLGVHLHDAKKLDDAEPIYHRALEMQEKLVADYPAIADYQSRLADVCIRFGMLVKDRGQVEASLTWFDRAIGLLRPVLDRNPSLAREKQRLKFANDQRSAAVRALSK